MMRLFYGEPAGDRGADNLFPGSFVSEELNGTTKDNAGNVRPRHARAFPQGLWQMIVENGLSRVFLGVHWSFDAFAVNATGQPDLTKNIGGVPLGLNIAEDIFAAAQGKGPVKSAIAARY
jgi:vanadium chloroperoxidase